MISGELPVRQIIVCGSGVIYWAGVVIQGRRIRRQIGRSPNMKPRGTREKLLWCGWLLVILVWIGQPLIVGTQIVLPGQTVWSSLLNPATLVIGLLLVALGYAGTLWCYAAMGNTWRIGINKREKNELVKAGPYQCLRHPIYFFQMLMLAGAALLLPTPLSFATVAVHYLCVLIKAKDEEKYLESVHGLAYRQYVLVTWGLFPQLKGRSLAKQDVLARP